MRRQKHRWPWLFGEFEVFSVLRHTNYLYSRSIRHLVKAADRVLHGAEDSARELLVDYGDRRRILVVVPRKAATGEHCCSFGVKVFRRYVIEIDVAQSGIRGPQVVSVICKNA